MHVAQVVTQMISLTPKAEDIRNQQPYLGAISEILTLAKYPLQLHIRQM
jgi:hypothetical protein